MIIDILRPDGIVRCSKCVLHVNRYADNDNIAIEAYCTDVSCTTGGDTCEPGEPWGTLTVNPGEKLPDDQICIKDYSEGSGNLRTLSDAGLVEIPPIRTIKGGFVSLPVCRLTERGKELVRQAFGENEEDEEDEDEEQTAEA